ncbi:maleylpyruvate isomerase N-terminal domain-containing protein [Geodermatophilus poikilotrophus]|uniref:maleylpyruvate isomerase N-terminal domain-containing protein n=1 Tax=Geodermatophilus poikilotrophus TaxID=1333667 RepID=UPI000B8063D5
MPGVPAPDGGIRRPQAADRREEHAGNGDQGRRGRAGRPGAGAAARRLEGLDDTGWWTPSLRAGWSVRDLVVHLLMPTSCRCPGSWP